MSVTIAQFKASHPDFDGFTDTQIQEFLDLAAIECPATVWDVPIKRSRGIKLKTAHYLECLRAQQALSAATAQSVAQGQASLAAPPSGDDLDTTIHGQQFKQLARTLPKRIGFAF